MKRILLILLIASSCWGQWQDWKGWKKTPGFASDETTTPFTWQAVTFVATGVANDSIRLQATTGYSTYVDSLRLLIKAGGYPSSRTDGTLIFAGDTTGWSKDTTVFISGLTDTTIYYGRLYQREDTLLTWKASSDTALVPVGDIFPPDSAAVFIVTSTTKETVRIRANTFPTDIDSGFIVRSPTAISTLLNLDTLYKFATADTGNIADSTFDFPVVSDTLLNWAMQLQDALGNEQNSTQWNKESEVAIDSIGPSGGGGGSWPEGITLFQTFENGAIVDSGNGDYSIAGDITPTTNGTPTITGTDEIFGDSAAAWTAASTWYSYDISGGTFLTADQGKIGMAVRIDAIANTNTILNLYETGTSSGPDNRFSVTMHTGGNLGFEWDQDPTGTSNISMTGGTISPGDTVFVVAWFDQSDGRRKAVVYDMNKTGLDSVSSDAALDAVSGWGSMQIGSVSPSGSPDIVVDNVILATDSTIDVLTYLDSLTYGGGAGGGGGADTTPPDSASSFIVSSPNKDSVNVALSGYATDATNTIINYKTGSYPTSRTDGTTQFNFAMADSNAYKDTTFFYDAPADNTILYFSAWHRDAAANWSTTALRNKDTVSVDSTGGAVVTPGPEGASLFVLMGMSGATKSTTVNGNSLATQAVENTTYYIKSDSTGSYITQ